MTEMIVTKRTFLASAAALIGGLVIGGCSKKTDAPAETFEVTKSPAEWRAILTPAQYDILREAGTERPFSSPLNKEYRAGTFVCAADGNRLFSSETKFDSGTGWPSFTRPLPDAVIERPDPKLFVTATEVLCRRCGGHLGHIIMDGPPPTHERYCMNGVAMEFIAA